MKDYRHLYYLENYLFDTVNERFHQNGFLEPYDFFCVILWKANRAKSKVANRILKFSDNLTEGVYSLTSGIAKAGSPRERLRILLEDWGFRLPIASAILTVLYPETFSVYDIRVCDSICGFKNVSNISNFDRLWLEYQNYIDAVSASGPSSLSLRDKDKWLWGKSVHEQLQNDLCNEFGCDHGMRVKKKENEIERRGVRSLILTNYRFVPESD